MSNITVSSAVDTMLQSANNSAIRSNIGALSSDDLENISITFGDEINFDDQANFNGGVDFQDDITIEGDVDASNAGSFEVNEVTVNGSAEFQDTVELSGADLEFTAGGGQAILMGGGTIGGAVSIEATSFLKVSPITTTARNALSASNGMIIYNTTDNKFQAYENGAWANLI